MAVLNLYQVIELKKFLSENFGAKLHLHDACGGQFFTLDTMNNEIKNFILEYCKKQNVTPKFSDENLSFSVGNLYDK